MDSSTVDTLNKLLWGGMISTGLVALVVWFLTRYIKSRDDFEKTVTDEIKLIPAKIKESVSRIQESQREIQSQVEQLKNTNISYQQKINHELTEIERHALKTEAIMEKTADKALSLETKIGSMNDMVVFHDKVLRDLINVAKDLRVKVGDNEQKIETVIKNISDDKFMVGQKPKKPR